MFNARYGGLPVRFGPAGSRDVRDGGKRGNDNGAKARMRC
jgi:hypothetical protein